MRKKDREATAQWQEDSEDDSEELWESGAAWVYD